MPREQYMPSLVVINPGSFHTDVRGYASLSAAISAIGAIPSTLMISQDVTVAASMSIPATITLRFTHGAIITVNTGQVLTINGKLVAPPEQIFSCIGGEKAVLFALDSVPEVFAEWWGIDGTADSIQIQSALDSLENVGGVLSLLAGSYAHTTTMTVYSNITIKGAGKYLTRLVVASGSILAFHSAVAVDNFTIRDLWIGGPLFQNDTAAVSATSSNLVIENCVMDGYINSVKVSITGIKLHGYVNAVIKGCDFLDCGATGLYLDDDSALNPCEDIRISDCLFYHRQVGGTYTNPTGIYHQVANNVVISNCVFRDIVDDAGARAYGYYCDNVLCTDVSITGCRFIINKASGKWGHIYALNIQNVSITGNTFGANTVADNGWGVNLVDQVATDSHFVVSGNTMKRCPVFVALSGTANQANVAITGNSMSLGGSGVFCYSATGGKALITITGNVIKKTTGVGIGLIGMKGKVIIIGNSIIDCNTAGGGSYNSAGIGFSGSARSVCIGNYIGNESVDGGLVYGFYEVNSPSNKHIESGNMFYGVVSWYNGYNAAPTAGGTWEAGEKVWDQTPAGGAAPGWVCITKGTFSAAASATGISDGATALITGIDSTADLAVGEHITTNKGFPNSTDDGNGVHTIIEINSATSLTIDENSDSAENPISIATPDPVFKAMANLAA